MLRQFKPLHFFIPTLLVSLLTACGGGGGGGGSAETDTDDPSTPVQVMVGGTVQKGPFSRLEVKAYPLNTQGQRGEPFSAQVTGDRYEFQATKGSVYQIEATGDFQDELTGETVQLSEPLSAVTPADELPQNINILTDLAAAQFSGSMTTTTPLAKQIGETEKNLMQQFGFDASTDPGLLDLTRIEDEADLNDPNLSLLLLSGSVMDMPRRAGRMPESYGGMVEGLRQGLAPETVLPAFAGLDAADLYRRIRESNVINGLPDLVLASGNSFLCNPDCGWIFETEPRLSVANVSVREASGVAEIVLRRSGGVLANDLPAFTVELTSENGTAEAGFDYVSQLVSVSFAEGERRQTLKVPLLIDALSEAAETFRVQLGQPDITLEVSRQEAMVTILDDLPETDADATGQLALVEACLIGDGPPASPFGLACSGIMAPVDAYSLSSPYALAVSLALQADCTAAGACSVLDEDWPMALTLLAQDSGGTEVDRTLLGHYLYPSEAIYDRNALMASPQQSLVASVNPASVIEFLFRAWQNNWEVRLLASVEQGGLTQVAELDIPQLRPLPDTVRFGEEQLTVSPDNPIALIPEGASNCPEGELEVEGTYLFPLTFDGEPVNQPYSGIVCTTLNESNGRPANLVVTSGQIPLEGTFLPLPPLHRMLVETHFSPDPTNTPWIRSGGALNFLIFSDQAISFYRQILSAEHLPYGFEITGGNLGPQGFVLDYSATHLIAHGVYETSDERREDYNLNTAIFADGQSGTLILRDAGIETTTQFNDGSAVSGWPQGQLIWEAFSVSVTDSQLENSSLKTTFVLAQSADCRTPGCVQGVTIQHGGRGESIALGKDGSLLGTLTEVGTQGVAWGVRETSLGGNDYAWRRPADLTESDQATLQLPGFLVPDGESVVDHLVSHRGKNAQGILPYAPGTNAFRKGNYYPPGVTFGPEIYADANGQPDATNGQDIGNRPLEVDFGSDMLPIITHTASKYVLRNGGVTGVFNADPAQLPGSVSIYGYPIEFDRFAVRLEDNKFDTYSWVDGGLALAGDAGFPVAFESLAIDCGGQLGAATLSANQCDGNCQLASWRADTRLFDFRFTNASGQSAPQCSVADQRLTLMQEAEFLALDKPLMLDVTWSPEGMVERSVLQNQAQYRLDSRDNADGFPVALTQGELMTPWDDTDLTPARYGTVALGGKIGVPFWEALDSDIRLANGSSLGVAEAEPSVPLPRNTLLSGTPPANLEQTNRNVLIDRVNDASYDITARYEWGNTGFGFGLPVFYDLPENSAEPQFLGRRWEQDLFVLEASAGIDFITPQRTKLSFGASADFDRLENIRFQIDLNSLSSLEKVDELLLDVGLINQPVISPVLNAVSTRVEQINAFSQQGIDTVMEKALLEGIERVGAASSPLMPNNKDPFDLLAETMAQIRGYPDQLVAGLDEELLGPIQEVLDEQEIAMRAPLQAILQELYGVGWSDPVPGSILNDLNNARNSVEQARTQVAGLLDPVRQAADTAIAGINDIEGWLDEAELAVAEINQIAQKATEFSATQCTTQGSNLGSEVDGFLHNTWQHMANLRSILSVLEGGELLGLLADQVVSDPGTQRSMNEARRTLTVSAELLLTKLNDAEQAVRNELCGTQIADLLFEVTAFTDQIENDLGTLRAELFDTVLSDLEIRLGALTALASRLEILVVDPLDILAGYLDALHGQLENADTYTSVNLDSVNQEIYIATDGRIDMLLEQPDLGSTGVDVFSYAFDGARDELNSLRDLLVQELQNQLQGRLPMATMTADQLRRHLVGQIMAAGPIKNLRETLNTELAEVQRQLRDDLLTLADQANQGIREAIATVESSVNDALADATAGVRDIPLTSASMDGYGVIAGHELERAHLQAEWTMKPSSDGEEGNTFGASLSAVSWSASNKDAGCAAPGADSNLDVTIAAMNLPARVAGSDITLKKVYLGFTLANATGEEFALNPIGVFGGLAVLGDISFTQFVIYDPAFAAGLGTQEVYIGASAGALFSDIQAEVAFLLGRTCNQDILLELDPEVAKFIPIPDSGFAGAYVRGSASIPVWATGCPLTIGVSADMGSWVLAGPPLTLGGLVGGGAYGKVLCVGSLRGQVKAIASVNTDGDVVFVGEGFGVAGAGFCEPASWTSVSRSRRDSWCGTGDARFQAGYQNGWSVMDLSASAIY